MAWSVFLRHLQELVGLSPAPVLGDLGQGAAAAQSSRHSRGLESLQAILQVWVLVSRKFLTDSGNLACVSISSPMKRGQGGW